MCVSDHRRSLLVAGVQFLVILVLLEITFSSSIISTAQAHKIHHHKDAAKSSSSKCHLIPGQNQLVFTNFNDNLKSSNEPRVVLNNNRRRSAKTNGHTRLKIFPYFHESFYKLPHDILKLYHDNLIPDAIAYWESSLRVKYPYFPIYLGRLCASSQFYYSENTKSVSCESTCASETKCGDYITIPEEHLDVCRYCKNGNDCREDGVKYPGINADFILYISSINTEHCNISNTVAFASYCQLESKFNRPVAGYVNICPQSVSSKQSDIHSALATLKHEILHALGFSAGLYAFFLDQNGNPLTPRDPKSGKPPFNPKTNMYEPSEKVVKVLSRKNWKIIDGFVEKNVTMIVTAKVVQEVRRHFNCSTLEGAELEDQGEIGTKLTHWEKRVFENEAMTGTYTQNSVFSRVTFAFLEDTGWYVANYSNAEELSWGKNLGCDFVKKSCKDWIENRLKKQMSIRPFCNTIPNLGDSLSSSKYECNEKRDAVLLCNMMKYNHQIPYHYRNFDMSHHQNLHLHKSFNKSISLSTQAHNSIASYLGGSVILADYCPFMQQVSWSINNEIRDSKCLYEENAPDRNKNYILEEYGRTSRCFLHNRSWQIYADKCQSRITVSKTIGCYNYMCDPEQGLLVKINDNYVKCTHKDEVVEFTSHSDKKNFNVYFGNIVCPSCEELCKDQIKCPSEDYERYVKERASAQSSLNSEKSSEEAASSKPLLIISNRKQQAGSNPNKNLQAIYLHNQHEYCLKQTKTMSSQSTRVNRINYPWFIIAFLLTLGHFTRNYY